MLYSFQKLSKDILIIDSQKDFDMYLESNFVEIEEYFLNITNDELDDIKFDIEDFLYDLLDNKLIQKQNSKIANAFLILLAEKFLQTSFIGAITILVEHLPKGATKFRLEAAKLYLRINDITKDYFIKSDGILSLIEESAKIDEYNTNAIRTFFYFIQSALGEFQRINNISLAKTFIEIFLKHQQNFSFLQDSIIKNFLNSISNLDLSQIIQKIKEQLDSINLKKSICQIDNHTIQKENSEYSKALYNLPNADFTSIRNIANKYIQSIGDPIELYNNLQRGEKIIDDERLLYKYLVSFGNKHKDKLYSSFEVIIENIKNEKFDIIDWGCGQGTATMLLLNYAKERDITLDIDNITLIEPSSLALSRALLHIDVLKQKKYNVKAINSDLDCLNENNLQIQSNNKTLHLFSNILDIESFILDNTFFKKVSQSFNTNAIFVCVSPYRSDKNNNRLDLFFNHFDENFNTELISSRDTDIGNATRYEKIFEVKYITEEVIEEKRQEMIIVEKNYHIDVIDELSQYTDIVVPILNLKILENSINTDPDYAIFKIRKVAEIITTQIYSKYEDNEQIISFNDKIRYLAYEQKVFTKASTNYVQTLRTIGNRGVHGNEIDISKLRLDAHLMVIALISFIKEIKDDRLI